MKFFKSKSKPQEPTPFNQEPPVTGGNAYILDKQLKVQEDIDRGTINQGTPQSNSIKNKLQNVKIGDIINKNIPQPYFLLQLQGDYFCNTIKFKTDNQRLNRVISEVIRASFLYGEAGIVFDSKLNTYYGVVLVNSESDLTGERTKIEVAPINQYLTSKTMIKKPSKKITLKGERVKEYVGFKWGVNAYGAWINGMWQFTNFFHTILTQMNLMQFMYIKKYVYKVNNQNAVTSELEMFFDILNPFIFEMDIGNKGILENRITTEGIESKGEGSIKEFLEYKDNVKKEWYSLFGRRVNDDQKKERNITTEVEASQESYDNLQNDYKNQFSYFFNEIQKQPMLAGTIFDDYEVDEQQDDQEQTQEPEGGEVDE